MELPFLYAHGALVWKVLLVALVLLTFAAVMALRGWIARRDARRDLRALVATPLTEGDVVLLGKLVQGSASTLVQDLVVSSERTSGLVIVHEGERIVIDGDVTVTHGSRARRWWLRPPRDVEARWCLPSTHEVVVTGDEVIVSGVLARVPEVAGYRESASYWELTSASIAARAPQTKALPLGMVRWVMGAAIFGAIWYGVLQHVGTKAIERAQDDWQQRSEIAPHDALAIAAAMPGSRDKAFELLIDRLERSFEKTEGIFQLRLQLEQARGRCPAYALFKASRFEEAAAAARRCDPNLLMHALLYLGRYREVGALAAPGGRIAALAAIAEGRWADAAPYAEQVAKDFDGRSPVDDVEKADLETWAAEARCVAALFRAWGGDQRAFQSADEQTGGCITTRALAAPIEVRGHALELAMWKISADTPGWTGRKAGGFALAYGGHSDRPNVNTFDAERWLVPFVLESNPQNRWLHEDASLLEIERGNLVRAKDHIDAAIAVTPARYRGSVPRSTIALLQTRALVDPDDVHYPFERAARVRRGEHIAELAYLNPETCKLAYERAVDDARRGDGRALAAVHRRCNVHAISPSVLFGVLPLVDKGRDELARALRFHRREVSDYHFPFTFLESAWWTRDISRMVGDNEEYERWKAIYDRHAAVLADREKLIALLILIDL